MTVLSVNVNKVAWLRNARGGGRPDVVAAARTIIGAGAGGITVHPRPDQRHITPTDTIELATLVADHPGIEYNIEGNPATRSRSNGYPGFLALIERCRPDQATLVPDADAQLTSDHGFDLLSGANKALKRHIRRCQAEGARVSLFMDPDIDQISAAADCGTDRIELYTGPFADQYARQGPHHPATGDSLRAYIRAAEHAARLGLGVNAGHDLNLDNLQAFRDLPQLDEVSIGHALIADALDMGLHAAVGAYRARLDGK